MADWDVYLLIFIRNWTTIFFFFFKGYIIINGSVGVVVVVEDIDIISINNRWNNADGKNEPKIRYLIEN